MTILLCMNQDPRRTQTGTGRFEAAPTRYIAWGALILLAAVLLCVGVFLLANRTQESATVTPSSRARIDLATPLQPGQPMTLVGSGFQAGERIEIFVAPGPDAAFDQLMKLAEATSDGNGNFVLTGMQTSSGANTLYLVARGSGSGFTSYSTVTGAGDVSPAPIEAPTATSAAPPPPTEAPAPLPTTLPTVLPTSAASVGLPDLAVGSVSIETQLPYACTQRGNEPPLGVKVEVRNTTPYPAGPFIVQVNNAQYTLNGGLEGGKSIVLWFPGYLTGLNRVTVDSGRTVAEVTEDNNIIELPLPVPTAPPPCPRDPGPLPPPPVLPPPPHVTHTPPPPPPPPPPSPTPDPNAVGVWYAQYYANPDLFEPAAIRRYEPGNPYLNLDWRSVSPGAGVPPNGFSAVFTRIQDFPNADNYVFELTVDDGARVYVDGVLMIDEWRNGPLRTVQAARGLTRGMHIIRVEYYESTGNARVGLTWRSSYSGWRGRYYNNTDRSGQPVLIRDDSDPSGGAGLFYEWGFSSPAPEVAADNFSVDWQRALNFGAGTYVFTAEVDDGVRVFLDGTPLMDAYTSAGGKVITATRTLAAGAHSLQVQYVEYSGQARFRFFWDLYVPPATATALPTATPPPTVAATAPPATATPLPMATATIEPTAPPPPPPPIPPTDTVTPVAILLMPTETPAP